VLDGGPEPSLKGAIFGDRGAHCKVWGLSTVSCAKKAEPTDLLFGLWKLKEAQVQSDSIGDANVPSWEGATWRIRLNRLSAAAMRPYVKLL